MPYKGMNMLGNGSTAWPALCGEPAGNLTYGANLFWDDDLTLNTVTPDLSPCFQLTVLTWLPCCFLVLASLFYIPYLCQKQNINKWRDKGLLNIAKLILGVFLILISIAEVVYDVIQSSSLLFYIYSALRAVAFLLATYTMHKEFQKDIHTSAMLLLFWVLTFVGGLVTFRSYILQVQFYQNQGQQIEIFRLVTFYLSYLLIAIQLMFTFCADYNKVHPRHAYKEEEEPLLHQNQVHEQPPALQKTKPECPEERVTIWSNITHWWILGTILKGYKKTLVFSDLFDIMRRDKCDVMMSKFYHHWTRQIKNISFTSKAKQEKEKKNASLMWALAKSSAGPLIISALARAFCVITEFGNPVFLNLLIDYIQSGENYSWKGYVLAITLLVVMMLNALMAHVFMKYSAKAGIRSRAIVSSAVYRKALKLSGTARRNTTVGEIVNLMSVDAQKLHDICFDLHESWASILTMIICVVLLWNVIGISALAGVAFLVLLMPYNGIYIAHRFAKLQDVQMKQKDTRIKFITEILNSMKIIKMYAWEPSFRDKVTQVRGKEMDCIKSQAYLLSFVGVTWLCAPYLISVVVFGTYILISPDNILTPQKAFVTISLLNILNWCLSFLPIFTAFAAQAYISLKRLTRYLLEDEINPDDVKKKKVPTATLR